MNLELDKRVSKISSTINNMLGNTDDNETFFSDLLGEKQKSFDDLTPKSKNIIETAEAIHQEAAAEGVKPLDIIHFYKQKAEEAKEANNTETAA